MFMGKGKMFTDKIKKNILDSSLNRKIMLIVLCNIFTNQHFRHSGFYAVPAYQQPAHI